MAPMLASRRDDIGFVVLLAALGVPGDELMRRQNERIYAALGFPADRRERLLGLLDRLFAILKSDASVGAATPEVEAIVREQMQANGVSPAEQQDAQVSAAAAQALAPAMRALLRHDPRPALARTRVPVLALNGDTVAKRPAVVCRRCRDIVGVLVRRLPRHPPGTRPRALPFLRLGRGATQYAALRACPDAHRRRQRLAPRLEVDVRARVGAVAFDALGHRGHDLRRSPPATKACSPLARVTAHCCGTTSRTGPIRSPSIRERPS